MLTVRMQHEDATIAQLPETVDYDNTPLVGAQCEDLVNRGCTTLVLDASQVQYMDSSGISMLITLSRTLNRRAGNLRVAALSAHYEQVWRMLGLEEVFPVFPTVNAALQPPAAGDIPGTPEEWTTPDMPAAWATRTEKTPG
ncbi:STAS domain-containing protein [Streptomyces fodineus]|nr:STAS domain-containing protein [Streptomyces fodineus]